MSIQNIMVIGAGQMGSGIAQVCAMAGYDVTLHDIKEEFVQKGIGTIQKNLNRQVEKGRMEEVEKEEYPFSSDFFYLVRKCFKSRPCHRSDRGKHGSEDTAV